MLGLYLHIPFCASKCNYCDFYSLANGQEYFNRYCSALMREITIWGEKLKGTKVDTVYFGGGTPSVIGYKNILNVLNAIKINFCIEKDCEITTEVNPDTASEEFLRAIFENGVNRLSVGVQSFNDDELITLGRPHRSKKAIETICFAKNIGFKNISLDLMFALPNQTLDTFAKSIDTALSLEPTHISSYALKVEENTPFYYNKNNLLLPNEDEEYEMYHLLCERLSQNGYHQYEISNFAKDGFQSKHNNKYWFGENYLGLGAAAHSFMNGKRFYAKRDIQNFIDGNVVYENEEYKKIEEYIFLRLRTKIGISFLDLEKLLEEKTFHKLKNQAKYFSEQGFGTLEDEFFHLNQKGFWVSNAIISKFIDSLG